MKRQRKKKNLTQSRLGELVGISQGHISKMERDVFTHSPTLTQIILISDVLEIDQLVLAEFFFEKERKYLRKNRGYSKKAVKTIKRDFMKNKY